MALLLSLFIIDMEMIEKAATAAAEWWAERFSTPSFDDGDNSEHGVVCRELAQELCKPVDDNVKDRFKEILKNKIIEALGDLSDTITIRSEYRPLDILHEACIESGMSVRNAPWMTFMIIDIGLYITIKEGKSGDMLNLRYR